MCYRGVLPEDILSSTKVSLTETLCLSKTRGRQRQEAGANVSQAFLAELKELTTSCLEEGETVMSTHNH